MTFFPHSHTKSNNFENLNKKMSESQKNDLFSPKLSIATFHLVRELGPGLPDKFAWLRVTRRPNSTPVWPYELSISQNNYILSQVRMSKKWPFLPETVNRDIPSCTWTGSGPAGQICMVAGHATTKLASVWAYKLSISQNNYILSQVRIS